MKIIPKFQLGGGIASMFTLYTPIQTILPAAKSDDSDISKLAKAINKEDDTKGKLTEKDLFSMLKDIDGLPNEMRSIVTNLENTFMTEKLLGLSTSDLASTYLRNLYLVKVASANKTKYDEAYKVALENGSLNEPAIAGNGQLVYQTLDGLIDYVDIGEYLNNPDAYPILSVSLLANIRAYDPRFNGNLDIFNTMQNSVGFESFLKILDQAKALLGSSSSTIGGLRFLSTGEDVATALNKLQSLSLEDKDKMLGILRGNYVADVTLTDKSNAALLLSIINYMVSVLPERAKTWAAWKTGNPNRQEAARTLVASYLLGREEDSHSVDVKVTGMFGDSIDKSSKSKDGTDSNKNPNEGFWALAVTGKGGEETSFNLLTKNTHLSTIGKFYGTTPGMDDNKSLSKYIGDSGVGYIIKNPNNITFGNEVISPDSFGDIMVTSGSGAMIATLPITLDGRVDFGVLDTYTLALQTARSEGLHIGTPEFDKRVSQILDLLGLGYLTSSNGLDMSKFGQFLILSGVANSKTKIVLNNLRVSMDDSESSYMRKSNDDDLYDTVIRALSTKDNPYDLDHNWLNFGFGTTNDNLYTGNIYIPITNNTLNAANADGTTLKANLAKEYERNKLRWDLALKLASAGSTNTNMLYQ